MRYNKSKKGFTLVEIMIVVVIIGLLAAMAIPAFNKIRESASDKAVTNDARQLAGAAQQYLMDNPNVGQITIEINPDTGEVTTDELDDFVAKVSKGVAQGTDNIIDQDGSDDDDFELTYRGVTYTFDEEGKYISDDR